MRCYHLKVTFNSLNNFSSPNTKAHNSESERASCLIYSVLAICKNSSLTERLVSLYYTAKTYIHTYIHTNTSRYTTEDEWMYVQRDAIPSYSFSSEPNDKEFHNSSGDEGSGAYIFGAAPGAGKLSASHWLSESWLAVIQSMFCKRVLSMRR